MEQKSPQNVELNSPTKNVDIFEQDFSPEGVQNLLDAGYKPQKINEMIADKYEADAGGQKIVPYVPTGAEQRVEGFANILQGIGSFGDDYLGGFLSSLEDPYQARKMSGKLLRLVDPYQQGGIGEFLPGFSYDLAAERKDRLGQGLSLLDLIPGGAVIGAPVKAAARTAAEEAAKKTKDKGIAGLSESQAVKESAKETILKYAKDDDGFLSPSLEALIKSAPPNLKGKQITEWLSANANKGVKPKELEYLGVDEFVANNPKATISEVLEGVSSNKVKVGKAVYGDEGTFLKFDVNMPERDPISGKPAVDEQVLMEKERLQMRDDFSQDEFVRYVNGRTTTRRIPFNDIDELEDFVKQGNITSDEYNKLIDAYAADVYRKNPFEMITPKGDPAITEQNIFAYGNDTEGYLIYSNGEDITNKLDPPMSRAEAQIQIQNELENIGFRNTSEGAARYKTYIDETLPGGANYREVVFTWDNAPVPHDVVDHFSEDNQIAHALVRNRKLADGKQTLHVDELQSDLHTKGSSVGYRLSDAELYKIKQEIDPILDGTSFTFVRHAADGEPGLAYPREGDIDGFFSLGNFRMYANADATKRKDMFKITSDQISGKRTTESLDPNLPVGKKLLIELGGDRQKIDKFVDTIRPLIDEGPIPNYPFKDDWYVMSLKQLLDEAVRKGDDAISVSSSLPIELRYSDQYSKFYETLYNAKIPSAMKKLANKYGGKFEKTKLDELDTYGPLQSERSMLQDARDGEAYAVGYLKRNFDNFDQKYGLKDIDEIINNMEETLNVNTIRITPEMREKILEEGLPSFAFGGPVLKPISLNDIDIFNS